MGKFGKRSTVNTSISHYTIGLLGEGGIGKTTLMANVCEKEFGADGYIILDMGKEDGVECLEGFTYETIENYKKWDAVTKDIIANKETDYPNLKVLVLDTLDQLAELTEPEVVRRYNAENVGKKDFTSAKTINGAYGGFGRGEEMVTRIILDRLWELKSVGVSYWFTGHVKSRETIDPLSGQTYTSLTTNMMQKYFTAFKTKAHIVGVACIDREIIKEGLGRKNIVTKQEVTRNKIVSESRVIKFRDENYCIDGKSRFSNIKNEIRLDTDEFIDAIKEAIKSASSEVKTEPVVKKSAPAKKTEPVVEETPIEEPETIEDLVKDEVEEDIFAEEETVDKEALLKDIRSKFKSADADTKATVRSILKDNGFTKLSEDIDIEILNEIMNVF